MTKSKDRAARIMGELNEERSRVLIEIADMAEVRQKATEMGDDWIAAIKVAHKLGVPNTEIARVTGLTGVRVSQIIHGQRSGAKKPTTEEETA